MKRNIRMFGLLVVAVALVIGLTGCNWAPEGNAWDYKTVEQNDSAYKDPYEIAPDKKYKGFGYLSTYSYGSGAGWKFKNNTEETVTCKFADKFYHSQSSSKVYVNSTKIENPKNGFEVPAGASVEIEASCGYYQTGGSSREKFYQFFLACH